MRKGPNLEQTILVVHSSPAVVVHGLNIGLEGEKVACSAGDAVRTFLKDPRGGGVQLEGREKKMLAGLLRGAWLDRLDPLVPENRQANTNPGGLDFPAKNFRRKVQKNYQIWAFFKKNQLFELFCFITLKI